MRRTRPVWFILCVLVAVSLSGCIGIRRVTPKPQLSKVSGVVLAPAGIGGLEAQVQVQSVGGTVPLAGATVQAFSLPELTPLGNPVTTDADGRYTIIGLPVGEKVVIVATKMIGGVQVRLSTFVAAVTLNTIADIDPVTSLAAEVLAEKARLGATITQDVWNQVYTAAQAVAAEMAEIDVIAGGSLFPVRFGDGLRDNEVSEQIWPPDLEPEEDVEQAKAMVRTLRDAGYSLQRTVEAQLAAHKDALQEDVAPFVETVGEGFLRLLQHLDIVYELIEGLKMPPGTYEYLNPGFNGPIDTFTEPRWVVTLSGEPVEIETTLTDGGTTQELRVVSRNSGSTPFTHKADITYILAGASVIQIDGTFTLYESEARQTVITGTATVDTVQTIDGEKWPETVTFDGTVESALVSLTGAVTVTYVPTQDDDEWVAMVSQATVDGDLATPTLSLTGTAELRFIDKPATFDRWPVRSFLNYARIIGSLTDVTATPFTVLEGEFSIDWTNAGDLDYTMPVSSTNFPKGTVQFSGDITAPGEEPIAAVITVHSDVWGVWTSEVALTRLGKTLEGSVEYVYAPSRYLKRIELTDERGLHLWFTYTDGVAQGAITKDGKQLATISKALTGVVVDYADGTYHSIF